MRKLFSLFWLLTLVPYCSLYAKSANEPDSVYLFAYSTSNNIMRNGLHFAWSVDRKNWEAIGPELSFLKCDYGGGALGKKMITPFLFQGPDQLWRCLWSLNENDGVFALAISQDLVYWKSQSYPVVMKSGNCLQPEVIFNCNSGKYEITWLSTGTNRVKAYRVITSDFKAYSDAKEIDTISRPNLRKKIQVNGNEETGVVRKVSWKMLDGLQQKKQLEVSKRKLNSENLKDDAERFSGLQPINAIITVNQANNKMISNKLIGAFFEDLNYSADGGLYAELIQNRGFEYTLSDKDGKDKTWNSTKAWSLNGNVGEFTIDSVSPLHPNNKHYALLKITKPGVGLMNEGFDGMVIKAKEKYDFSVFVRNQDGKAKGLLIRLVDVKGEVLSEAVVKTNSISWKKYSTVLTAQKSADARLEIVPQAEGTLALDMISLFPQKTFKGHKNGLRVDLAQLIADIHPKFVRFPGGCLTHGDGIDNIYKWKNTIGPLEARKPMRNIWRYHQTMGLGYFEYFQYCEDMGAEPLPVIAAGVPCQNSTVGGPGQQGGISMREMDQYVQDILDLIEWANGDVKTKWGKIRAEAGHLKPFNLKYIGIGNEDLISDIFEERFTMIFKAIKEKHPEITVIGTAGPFSEGTDYVEGWKVAIKLGVPMVDEHYYQPIGWFLNHQDFYDKYDRNKPKVYLGEYASRGNTLANALVEALYLTSIERNGDVVSMSSYAPLLAKEGHTQWNPDMIYFNNNEAKPTVNYYVQKLYGQNAGDTYITTNIKLSEDKDDVKKRIGVSLVRDSETNDLILKLVNMLPVAVNSIIDLKAMGLEGDIKITKTVLQGKPDDKNVQPQESYYTVNGVCKLEMAAYSFTVYRLK